MTTKDKLIEFITRDLVCYLMEDNGVDEQTAMSVVYNSDLYEKLNDTEIQLYVNGSAYIYDFLKEELASKEMPLNTGREG